MAQRIDMADEGTGVVNLTLPPRPRPALRPRQAGALAMIALALSLIFGLVAMHALTQEGAAADAEVTAGSVQAPQVLDGASVLAVAECSVCVHDRALGSAGLWMAVFACAMLVFVAIWRVRSCASLIGMRLPPGAVPAAAPFRQSPRPMSLDLLSLCVLRT